jgi:hypothetical protein
MNKLKQELQQLLSEDEKLQQDYNSHKELIDSILDRVNCLQIEKAVMSMKIHFNRVKGKKCSSYYVQARGAVPYSKGKRKWAGCYLGKQESVYDDKGEVLPHHRTNGIQMVRAKVTEMLKKEFNII